MFSCTRPRFLSGLVSTRLHNRGDDSRAAGKALQFAVNFTLSNTFGASQDCACNSTRPVAEVERSMPSDFIATPKSAEARVHLIEQGVEICVGVRATSPYLGRDEERVRLKLVDLARSSCARGDVQSVLLHFYSCPSCLTWEPIQILAIVADQQSFLNSQPIARFDMTSCKCARHHRSLPRGSLNDQARAGSVPRSACRRA